MKQDGAPFFNKPTFVDANGTKYWKKEGSNHILHRSDGPAIVYVTGTQEWWENGERHRVGGPAIERADGRREWWENGERHRVGGPAIERADGSRVWCKNGKIHRLDGPAVEFADGSKQWWVEGKQHRINGPAVERTDGYQEWWVNGVKIFGGKLVLLKQAMDNKTLIPVLKKLLRNESWDISAAAAHNPSCPLEDQVEWALTRGEGLGE